MMLPTIHQQFYQRTAGLASELKGIENEVKQQEQRLLSQISRLVDAIKQTGKIKQAEPIKAAIQGYFDQTQQILLAWEQEVRSYKTGLSFRKKHGDSLLVFVYGKVKAGKSSLGNYIATGTEQPDESYMTQLSNQQHSPEFFIEAENKQFGENINHAQGFRVGAEETTSCIQGFTVPGLTWVDSPGLHSVNTANGDLAQEYVKSADLIIYPMNSAQPSRSTDLSELESLLKAGKRVLVLITRCDVTEQDVDDAGNLIKHLLMKDKTVRKQQQDHTQKELDALCKKLNLPHVDTSVLTLSVRYAEKNNNTPQAMQQAGIQSLFKELEDILTNADSIDFKKQVPYNNLHNFYHKLLAAEDKLAIAKLVKPVETALDELTKQQEKLNQLKETATARIEANITNQVDKLVEQYASSRNSKALAEALEQAIKQTVIDEYEKPLKDLWQTALNTLLAVPQDMGLASGLDFTDKQTDITIDISRKYGAVSGGLLGLLGTGIGFLLGGPPGAAIGGTIGGAVGAKAGSMFTPQETRTITVGDNREEIKDKLIEKSQPHIDDAVNALHQETLHQIFNPITTALKHVQQHTSDLQQYIKGQIHV